MHQHFNVPGQGRDIHVPAAISGKKVVRSKNTGKKYAIVSVSEEEVLLVPLSGNTLSVRKEALTTTNWEVCR